MLKSWKRIRFIFLLDTKKRGTRNSALKFITHVHVQQDENTKSFRNLKAKVLRLFQETSHVDASFIDVAIKRFMDVEFCVCVWGEVCLVWCVCVCWGCVCVVWVRVCAYVWVRCVSVGMCVWVRCVSLSVCVCVWVCVRGCVCLGVCG